MKVSSRNKTMKNKLLDWFIYMFGYALVLIIVSSITKSIYIDESNYGLYGLLAAIIIYILNKTIKPILFILTLPITAITLGIFYPFLNVIILKIVDIILGNHFNTNGTWSLFFSAILISIINMFMENNIIKPIIKR